MSLHWYACIFINTYCYIIYHILLETVWWVLSNASLIMQIHPAVHKILANRDFSVTDDLISQLFVVAFVHPAYVQIAFIWGFPMQLGLWKSVYWLWRYKLNEFCNMLESTSFSYFIFTISCVFSMLSQLMPHIIVKSFYVFLTNSILFP